MFMRKICWRFLDQNVTSSWQSHFFMLEKIGFEEASLTDLWCTYFDQQWLYVMVSERVHLMQEKGYEINWVKAIASTTKEKVRRKKVGRLKNGSLEVLDFNVRGEGSMWFENKSTLNIKPRLEIKSNLKQ